MPSILIKLSHRSSVALRAKIFYAISIFRDIDTVCDYFRVSERSPILVKLSLDIFMREEIK